MPCDTVYRFTGLLTLPNPIRAAKALKALGFSGTSTYFRKGYMTATLDAKGNLRITGAESDVQAIERDVRRKYTELTLAKAAEKFGTSLKKIGPTKFTLAKRGI